MKNFLLPKETPSLKFLLDIEIYNKKCPLIGNHDENVFDFVDLSFKDKYFYSSELSSIEQGFAGIYIQKDGVICSPKKAFEEISGGDLEKISFKNERYIKRIVMDYRNKLYFYWHGTFFIYKSQKGNFIIVQVNFDDDDKLEVTPYKFEEFNAPISALSLSNFVVFK